MAKKKSVKKAKSFTKVAGRQAMAKSRVMRQVPVRRQPPDEELAALFGSNLGISVEHARRALWEAGWTEGAAAVAKVSS